MNESIQSRCETQEVLVPLITQHGLVGAWIEQVAEDRFTLSVTVKKQAERVFLAARRRPTEPRKFKSVETAVLIAKKLFEAKLLTVRLL